MVVGKNEDLQIKYLKQAAEGGLAEAQHNLGVLYLEGHKLLGGPDSFKALCWFSKAGSQGFIHSQFNAAKLFASGSEDKKVKKNLRAAMVWLEKIEETKQLDVSGIIENVMKELMETEKGNNKRKNA